MLAVGVHRAQNRRIRVAPAVQDCPRQAALATTSEQPDARIFLRHGINDRLRSVATVVVDYDYFPIDVHRSKYESNVP